MSKSCIIRVRIRLEEEFMEFTKIDLDTWTRKEVFNHFIEQKTTYSMTSNLSITKAYDQQSFYH